MDIFSILSKAVNALPQMLSTVWCNLPLIILAILGIGFLIVFHEFGHFLFAKLFNVLVPSFSIGFGPRLVEKKIGETTFALSAIPLGGYVEVAGNPEVGQGEQAQAHIKGDRSFNSKPYWQKLLIMAAGILFNILFAYLALSLLFMLGAPCIGSWCANKAPLIGVINPNSPAEKAGLKPFDKIIDVFETPTPTISDVTTALEKVYTEKGKEPVLLKVMRNGQPQEVVITPDFQKQGAKIKPVLGVSWQIEKMPFAQALSEGWSATWSLIVQTASAIKGLTKSREGLGGPLMLICQVTQFAGLGMKLFLFMLAFISINLAVFNLLPLPIFDGGQVLFFTIEALLRRPLSDEARYKIHYYTWLMVIALVIYLTFKDVIKLTGLF